MDFFSDLEQFGFKVEEKTQIFSEESKKEVKTDKDTTEQDTEVPETEFLFIKHIRCPICEKVFQQKTVKNARVKRMEPDFDLRPRFQYIDTLKYEICSCPYCGYTAMTRYFDGIPKLQAKLIKENISSKFQPGMLDEPDTYTYEEAISRYKLALYNAIVKKAKNSEKAYLCLKISWLCRGILEEMANDTSQSANEKRKEYKALEEQFYKEAFEGFKKAISTEDFPICGMDSFTLDYMMAAIACHFKEYSYASKSVSNILRSQLADRRIKDKALDLKEQIVEEIKKSSGL